MANTIKGQKGFITLKEEQRLSKRVSAYLTPKESIEWKEYLKKNSLVSTEVIREFIKTLIP
jgi:hypothetical protein